MMAVHTLIASFAAETAVPPFFIDSHELAAPFCNIPLFPAAATNVSPPFQSHAHPIPTFFSISSILLSLSS